MTTPCTETARMERMEAMLEEVRTDVKELMKQVYIGNGQPSLKTQIQANTAFRLRVENMLYGFYGKIFVVALIVGGILVALVRVIK
jgi:hypothetical protein